jgi:hypothetical protein
VSAKTLLAADPSLLTEAQLSGLVVELARIGGWKRYHTFDSRRSNHGFPDWVFVKGPRLLFVELKSEVGKLRDEQVEWLDALRVVGQRVVDVVGMLRDAVSGNVLEPFVDEPSVEVHVWRPSDWELIVKTLTGRELRKEA